MVNLPNNVALGKLLNLAHKRALPTVTLCHGPGVCLSTCLEGTGETQCAYSGYKTMCFTDKTDAFTPKVGYLPGPMPWKVEETLEGYDRRQQVRKRRCPPGPRAHQATALSRSEPRRPGCTAWSSMRQRMACKTVRRTTALPDGQPGSLVGSM